ncbi:hypothetical protein HDV03_001149 [Kappamyces sp. JEL0829]|nr:hypothetical protein HDV03_001149 [Kappamyces sp. JEL0829]
MPNFNSIKSNELVTPKGGIFPGATLFVSDLSGGMGFDPKERIKTSPTAGSMPMTGTGCEAAKHSTQSSRSDPNLTAALDHVYSVWNTWKEASDYLIDWALNLLHYLPPEAPFRARDRPPFLVYTATLDCRSVDFVYGPNSASPMIRSSDLIPLLRHAAASILLLNKAPSIITDQYRLVAMIMDSGYFDCELFMVDHVFWYVLRDSAITRHREALQRYPYKCSWVMKGRPCSNKR